MEYRFFFFSLLPLFPRERKEEKIGRSALKEQHSFSWLAPYFAAAGNRTIARGVKRRRGERRRKRGDGGKVGWVKKIKGHEQAFIT